VLLNHAISGGLAVLLCSLAVLSILARVEVGIAWVGLDSIALIFVYVSGVWILHQNNVSVQPDAQPSSAPSGMTDLITAVVGFLLATALLIVVTPHLVSSAIGIAEVTGFSTGFVGLTLVAIVTSLPELVTTVAAARLGAFDLAVGNLFGSNCFNILILGVADFFYIEGLFLGDVNPAMTLAGMFALVLTAMGLFGNVARLEFRFRFIEPDSVFISVTYFLGMWVLYQRGLMG
jgi:cation:H+ antiporter